MAVIKRVVGSAFALLFIALVVSGCSKSDIDIVKDGFFAEDKTQNIGKFLETYKNVSGGKWQIVKDDRSRDVVVFSGTYSNKEVAATFLNDRMPDAAFADKFASFLDENKFSLSFLVNFQMSADKSSNTPFVLSALGLAVTGPVSNDKQNIDSGIKAVIGNLPFDSLLNKEDAALLNYYFEKFVAKDLLLSGKAAAAVVPLSYEFDFANLPGMIFSSIQDGEDSIADYYPIERIEVLEVKSNDAEKTVTYNVRAALTDAYLEALYGKDVGKKPQSLKLDGGKFDALNAKYEILVAKNLTFVKTANVPVSDFTLLSQSLQQNTLNIKEGQNSLQIFLGKSGAEFICSTSYPENEAVKAFKQQQERLYRVDNEVKLSLLQNAFIGAITGKKLSDKELHDEMVKGREQKYKENGWTLPRSLFSTEPADVI